MTENIKMPLEGIKVIELATVVAAPTAGRMLSAYGAEVIKIESLAGDDYRVAGNLNVLSVRTTKTRSLRSRTAARSSHPSI